LLSPLEVGLAAGLTTFTFGRFWQVIDLNLYRGSTFGLAAAAGWGLGAAIAVILLASWSATACG
jgi:hypothetical protein